MIRRKSVKTFASMRRNSVIARKILEETISKRKSWAKGGVPWFILTRVRKNVVFYVVLMWLILIFFCGFLKNFPVINHIFIEFCKFLELLKNSFFLLFAFFLSIF